VHRKGLKRDGTTCFSSFRHPLINSYSCLAISFSLSLSLSFSLNLLFLIPSCPSFGSYLSYPSFFSVFVMVPPLYIFPIICLPISLPILRFRYTFFSPSHFLPPCPWFHIDFPAFLSIAPHPPSRSPFPAVSHPSHTPQ